MSLQQKQAVKTLGAEKRRWQVTKDFLFFKDCRVGQDSRGIAMIDYGYDVAAQGYDLSGMPIHPLKHEHYKLDDSPVNLIMTKASITLFIYSNASYSLQMLLCNNFA